MSTTPASNEPDAMKWDSVALVTYVPEPLGSFLTGLRRELANVHDPEAHITFLPPRQLSAPIETAQAEAVQILRDVTSFEVELGELQVFPTTNILYLEVGKGRELAVQLHDALNKGCLFADEAFEFTPHLTLSDPLTPDETVPILAKAIHAWQTSNLSRRFRVDEVTLLWQSGIRSEREWSRLAIYPLARGIARGSSSAATQT